MNVQKFAARPNRGTKRRGAKIGLAQTVALRAPEREGGQFKLRRGWLTAVLLVGWGRDRDDSFRVADHSGVGIVNHHTGVYRD
ncbi:MAG: hypothetical protein ACRD4C_03780 [Candidatus Acidiferrales bacterium]